MRIICGSFIVAALLSFAITCVKLLTHFATSTHMHEPWKSPRIQINHFHSPACCHGLRKPPLSTRKSLSAAFSGPRMEHVSSSSVGWSWVFPFISVHQMLILWLQFTVACGVEHTKNSFQREEREFAHDSSELIKSRPSNMNSKFGIHNSYASILYPFIFFSFVKTVVKQKKLTLYDTFSSNAKITDRFIFGVCHSQFPWLQAEIRIL